MKDNVAKVIYRLLLVITVIVTAIIVGFTIVQMGVFSPEPKVEVTAKYTGKDVPELRIATDYDFCPNTYINSKGELSGLYIEIMTELANQLEMKPVFLTDNWLGCRAKLESGEADVLLGLEIFSNMKGTLHTIPMASDELCMFGKQKALSAAALSGKRVSIMARSVIIGLFDLQCEYVEYNTNTEILQAVENGEVDFAICHSAVGEKIIENSNLDLVRGASIMKSFPSIAVKDTNPELQDKLNTALQAMAEDGTLYKLKTKWIIDFTRNHTLDYVLENNQAFYIISVMSVILLLIISAVFRMYASSQERHIKELLVYQKNLEDSNVKAERANRAKSDFLSHMSHDVRTPLNGIVGMSGIIRKNITNPQRIKECLDNIDIASGHLQSMLSDVLDMSKLESREIELEHVAFSLDEELENVQAIVIGKLQEGNIDLIIRDDQVQHRFLIGSVMHFRRILLNLLSNAIKYSKENGHVQIIVSEIDGNSENSTVLEIKVQDDGIGMSRDFIENDLYKPFTQEHKTARTKYKGTGLGMAIVHELVDAMQGTIQVDSVLGKGTTFTVTLPFEIGVSPKGQEEKDDKSGDLQGMHLLVVEDNDLNREITQCVLEEAGAEVETAADGKQAVEIFSSARESYYDVILMDIMMPVMDGIEATRTIRSLARKDAQNIPIIAVTANAFTEDRKKTEEAGMNGHISKPIDEKKLLGVVANYKKA